MEGKRYTPHEFLKYIREPMSHQEDIDIRKNKSAWFTIRTI